MQQMLLAVILLLSLYSVTALRNVGRWIRPSLVTSGKTTDVFSQKLRLHMASTSKGGSSAGGGTALDTRVEQKTAVKPSLRDEIERDWRLILHDDTVHTIQEVCEILSSTCPLCSGPRAYEVTLEVHMTGAGTVCVGNKKLVAEYTKSLQAAGLTVSMSQDDEFEGGGDGDDDEGGEE